MKKEHAEKFVQFVEKFEVIFDEASYVTDFFDGDEERRTVRMALSGMLRSRFLLEELLLDEYPEFRDRLRPPEPNDPSSPEGS
ncbi:MAG: hypothetical protein ABL973_14425 [Micropepsaceae bacterium]